MREPFTSRLKGLYNQSLETRLALIAQETGLTEEEKETLSGMMGLGLERANHMIENTIGLYALPMGIATNFIVNNREVLIPMVVEEPSVVAGASLAAKLARSAGGFTADSDDPVMIGQIQLVDVPNPEAARSAVLAAREELLELADTADPLLVKLGGGARDIQVRILETVTEPMVIVHVLYDVRDAMGANAVNTACERLAPRLGSAESWTSFSQNTQQPGGSATGPRPGQHPGNSAGIRSISPAKM